MKEIEKKLQELWTLLNHIPEECKGDGNSGNRYRFLKIREGIRPLIEKK